MERTAPPGAIGLYEPANEHDSCGIALVAKLWGEASHAVVEKALTALANMEHRGAEAAARASLRELPEGRLAEKGEGPTERQCRPARAGGLGAPGAR